MESNPYAAPQAELERAPERPGGPVMPFEDPVTYPSFGLRVSETLRWLFLDLGKAGQGLGGSQALGAPIGLFALLGVAPAILVGLLTVLHPVQPIWQVWLGAPRATAPTGGVLVALILGVVIAGPIGTGIAILIAGLMDHLGLWIVRGTREGLGLLVTYRSVIYASTAITLVVTPLQLLGHLPGRLGSYLLLPSALLQVASIFYQGVLLAKAHRTDTWRGVLGVWLPILILGGLAAVCLGVLWILGGEVFQRALLQGVRGGK